MKLTLEQRIHALSVLGAFMKENDPILSELIEKSGYSNPWFTTDHIRFAIQGWNALLTKNNLENWTRSYKIKEPDSPKIIGLILAGNIPMVGFHDILTVLITGNKAMIKLSSQDSILIPFLLNKLIEIEPGFKDQFQFTERLQGFDAVIATGSNNSSRYFDHYFSKYPHIIRKNRNSVAVLKGTESQEDFHELGKDIFLYFGLGCRNVSKLYVPSGYAFDGFYEGIESFSGILDNHKYSNNYDYNRTLLLMNSVKHLDNRFLMISENASLSSPMASLHYEFYEDEKDLSSKLDLIADKLQCVVSKSGWVQNSFAFGESQQPALHDYADNVDTMQFLIDLN